MKKHSFIIMLSSAVSAAAMADSYQGEVSFGATRVNSEFLESDGKSYALSGSYYFSPVEVGSFPLAEAAYLGQKSRVYGSYLNVPSQNGFPSANGYAVGMEIYIPENFVYFQLGASRYKMRDPYNSNNDWSASVGLTPINGLLVSTSYSQDAGYNPNVYAKYVTEVGGQYINLEAGVADTDGSGTLSLIGGDYYFDETLSLGGKLQHSNDEDLYELRVRKFFTSSFSGGVILEDGEEENSVTVNLSLRF